MTQKRIFGFLWPDPAPVPVDELAHQSRYLRITGRGPLRVALLLVLTTATFGVGLMGTLVVATSPSVPALILLIAVLVTLLLVTARGWQVGTYVSDLGVRVIRMTRTLHIPWPDVIAIDTGTTAVVLRTAEGEIRTHVAHRGLDYLGRRESWDIARDRITNWWQGR
jgi:hypothetical protein